MTPKFKLATLLLILGGAPGALVASEKFDLNREVPVPANEPIPLLDFFRPEIMQSPKLNPSGTHIAAIVGTADDHTQLMVYDLKKQAIEMVGARGDSDIARVDWLNNERLIYSISVKKIAGIGLFVGDVGALSNAAPLLQYVGSTLVAVPPDDRTHPLVRLAENSLNTGAYGVVARLNTDVKQGKILDLSIPGADQMQLDETTANNQRHIMDSYPLLKTEHGFDTGYLADKEGRLAFGFTSEDGRQALHRLAGENWDTCPEDLEEINVIGCGDNSGEIVVVGPRQGGKPRPLEVLEGATGKVVEVLLQDSAYDFDGWLYRDPLSHLIVGAVYNRAAPRVTWFTEAYRNLQKVVDGLFPGMVVRILGTDEAGKIVLLRTFSDRQPSIYSWADLENHTAGLIKNSAPWIDPQRMQPMNVLKFKTRDGRHLDAYLTQPAGASKQHPPPLVVLPHAYITERDSWGYNAEVQFFTTRGYAVLQPNYRGSAGYGWMFPTDDEWAFRKMHEDVTDAVKTLIATGMVDRERVAIVGTSFGGFLALSGVAFEPDLYRCAVAISAVPDWGRVINDYRHEQYSSAFYSRMVFKLGDPKKEREKFNAMSPLEHAGQIRVPVLLSWSEYDPSVQISDLKSLASAVERNHVPVETMSFVNEADGVHHLGHKLELYTRIEAFLARNIGPAKPATAP